MSAPRTQSLLRLLRLLLALLAMKTVAVVVLTYPEYFSPDFDAGFLLGRQSYFWGAYAVAFYVHIVSGPFTLAAGLLLLSKRFQTRWPAGHRRLGRVQVVTILLAVVPSGLWMAAYANTGQVAGAGFATLSLVTAATTILGWRAVIGRRFEDHRRWMARTYALLTSAVVVRLIGGLTGELRIEGTYPLAAWLSWLLPLLVVEAVESTKRSGCKTPLLRSRGRG